MESLVYILLASYNGDKYIEKQLESIISQTYTNWRLLIRDDGSKDNTVSIVKKYCQTDSRISLIDEFDENKGKGACQNFGSLLNVATVNNASIIMFCDQDDYWFPNKVELMLATMLSKKSDMVYSKFLYADENLNELSANIQTSKSPFMFPSFKSVIVQNQVYGCTMMINGALAKKCLPIPIVAENHDYWITLVASGMNLKIYNLNEALMLYRQHGSNVTGSIKDHDILPRIKRFLFSFDRLRKVEDRKTAMLKALNQQLCKDLTLNNKKLLEGYFNALEQSKINFVFYCIKNKIKRQSLLSTIVYFIVMPKLSCQKNK